MLVAAEGTLRFNVYRDGLGGCCFLGAAAHFLGTDFEPIIGHHRVAFDSARHSLPPCGLVRF